MTVLQAAVTAWLALGMLSLSAFAVWAGFFTEPNAGTPLLGKVLHHFGRALVAVGLVLITGALLGAGIVVGMRVFSH